MNEQLKSSSIEIQQLDREISHLNTLIDDKKGEEAKLQHMRNTFAHDMPYNSTLGLSMNDTNEQLSAHESLMNSELIELRKLSELFDRFQITRADMTEEEACLFFEEWEIANFTQVDLNLMVEYAEMTRDGLEVSIPAFDMVSAKREYEESVKLYEDIQRWRREVGDFDISRWSELSPHEAVARFREVQYVELTDIEGLKASIAEDEMKQREFANQIELLRETEFAARKANMERMNYESTLSQYDEYIRLLNEYSSAQDEIARLNSQFRQYASNTTDEIRVLISRARSAYSQVHAIRERRVSIEAMIEELRRRWYAEIAAAFSGNEFETHHIESVAENVSARLDHVRAYQTFCQLQSRRNEILNIIVTRKEEVKSLEMEIESAKKLKQLAENLETRMLEQTISDLNASLVEICDDLYPDGTSLYMTLTKQNASNEGVRTSLDVHMIKPNGIDLSFDRISGGERRRFSFALMLAIADLPVFHSSPVLILDECFGGIESDRIEACVDAIKLFIERRPNKVVLVTRHDTRDGLFDYTKLVVAPGRVYDLVNGERVETY
jgi:hypothetical protein